MKKIFFLASVISLACTSCKSKKEVSKTIENPANTASSVAATPTSYRLIVSFISKGAGPDSEKIKSFLAYIDGHPKKPAYQTIAWGREGEVDYCFTLSELTSKKDLVGFIEDIKKIGAGNDMLIVSENAECQHKSR
jgi:hypothetical protein